VKTHINKKINLFKHLRISGTTSRVSHVSRLCYKKSINQINTFISGQQTHSNSDSWRQTDRQT